MLINLFLHITLVNLLNLKALIHYLRILNIV